MTNGFYSFNSVQIRRNKVLKQYICVLIIWGFFFFFGFFFVFCFLVFFLFFVVVVFFCCCCLFVFFLFFCFVFLFLLLFFFFFLFCQFCQRHDVIWCYFASERDFNLDVLSKILFMSVFNHCASKYQFAFCFIHPIHDLKHICFNLEKHPRKLYCSSVCPLTPYIWGKWTYPENWLIIL